MKNVLQQYYIKEFFMKTVIKLPLILALFLLHADVSPGIGT